MKIAPVDYMPVSKVPSDTTNKDQTGPLYLDEEEYRKIKKKPGSTEPLSMTVYRLDDFSHIFNSYQLKFDSYKETHLARRYAGTNKDRGFKTFVGWLVDTLV